MTRAVKLICAACGATIGTVTSNGPRWLDNSFIRAGGTTEACGFDVGSRQLGPCPGCGSRLATTAIIDAVDKARRTGRTQTVRARTVRT